LWHNIGIRNRELYNDEFMWIFIATVNCLTKIKYVRVYLAWKQVYLLNIFFNLTQNSDLLDINLISLSSKFSQICGILIMGEFALNWSLAKGLLKFCWLRSSISKLPALLISLVNQTFVKDWGKRLFLDWNIIFKFE